MQVDHINALLSEVQEKLVSLDLEDLSEAKGASFHDKGKAAAARKRLQQLYDKLTKGRSASNRVQARGARR